MGYARTKSQSGGYRSLFGDDSVEAFSDAKFCGSTSSREASAVAAKAIEPVAGSLRALVLEYVRSRGLNGSTCDEAEIALSMRHQTCSARVRELSGSGLIVDSGQKRKTSSGRFAVVHVADGDLSKRACKRCGKPPEEPVTFGRGRTEVYCQKCTCNECGESLEGWEETTCEVCVRKHETTENGIV